jgi:hypothetical protein
MYVLLVKTLGTNILLSLFSQLDLRRLESGSSGVPPIKLDSRIRRVTQGHRTEELGVELPLKVQELAHKVEVG